MNSAATQLLADLDKLPCGVIEVSNDRSITFCNLLASNLLGVSSSEVVGQRLENILSAASRSFIDNNVYPALLEKTIAQEVQLTLRANDGTAVPIVANIAVDANNSSLWTLMSCVNRDKLYEELISTRDLLSAQARELKLLNERIHGENEDLKIFCRSLSHDFTGPVRRIQQMLAFVVEDLRGKEIDVEGELELLELSISNSKSLMMLVKGLVEYLIADAHEPQDEIVDLNNVVSTAVSLNEGQDDVLFSVTTQALPTVIGSAVQLQVVFKNLIGNAIKYNENSPEIAVTCNNTAKQGYNVISIKDNGIGMSSEQLGQIFEPFSRLHAEGTYSGSGLGLSIVKKLVSKHNGDITVESAPGKGSTFHVSFPVVQVNDSGE